MPYNPFSRLDLYSNTSPRTCGPSRFTPVCVYDRYNVTGSSAPSLITPVKALEFGTCLNGTRAKESVIGRPPPGTLVIDAPEIGSAIFMQKGGGLLRLPPLIIVFSYRAGHLALHFIPIFELSMFDRPLSYCSIVLIRNLFLPWLLAPKDFMDYLAEFQNFVWLENHPRKTIFSVLTFRMVVFAGGTKTGNSADYSPLETHLPIRGESALRPLRKTLDKEPIPEILFSRVTSEPPEGGAELFGWPLSIIASSTNKCKSK